MGPDLHALLRVEFRDGLQGPVFPDATPKDRHVGSVEILTCTRTTWGRTATLNLGVVTMVPRPP